LFVTLVFTNYLLKLSLEVLVTPFCYLAVGILKKREHLDVYDTEVRYNPFGLGE
jgi:uncharacterized PurR-regulated membrane protein YhhQ (DUF165 family)